MLRTSKSAFTLIEILVSLAIVAVLSTIVVVTLNPAELLKQARDSNRISDLNTINTALGTYAADVTGASTGSSSTVYVSLPSNNSDCSDLGLPTLTGGWVYKCTTRDNLTKIDGSGWIPVNFQAISFGNPLEKLPIDQKNTTSTGLYYTFVTTGSWWELTAILESEKYGPRMVVDGGASPNAFEQGTMLTLTPTEALDRGVPPDLTIPSIASISPTSATAGDPGFTLTVNGENFTSSSVVKWGGSNKTTTFISAAQLTASILAEDISATGTIAVTVYDPVKGTSGGSNFAISAPIVFVAGGWTTDSTGGPAQSAGASIVEADGLIYIMAGGTAFSSYNPATKIWTALSPVPASITEGAAIVKYNNDVLYAFRGNGSATFWKYVISANNWYAVADAPGAKGDSGALAYPGTGDYIYGFKGGGSNVSWRYSVSDNSWGESGITQGNGASITEVNGVAYVLFGGSATFSKYDSETHSWTSLAPAPGTIGEGGSISRYDYDHLFILQGGTSNFWKYTISTDTWSTVANTPAIATYGAAITYPGAGGYLYALRGWGYYDFWRYSIALNSWSSVASPPREVYTGSLVSLDSNIYALHGGGLMNFSVYTISTDTWTSKATPPESPQRGSSMTSDGLNIYAFRGNSGIFWKYSPYYNSWSVLNGLPVSVGGGTIKGGLVYSPTKNSIFAVSGNSNGTNGSIFEYNILLNQWLGSAGTTPFAQYWGAPFLAVNSKIYGLQGGGGNLFYEYDIHTTSWTAKAATPDATLRGNSLTTDGTNIFATRGESKIFWQYTVGTNTWSALADTPVNIGSAVAGGIVYSPSMNAIYAISGYSAGIYKNSQ